jgi:hypothetical protein
VIFLHLEPYVKFGIIQLFFKTHQACSLATFELLYFQGVGQKGEKRGDSSKISERMTVWRGTLIVAITSTRDRTNSKESIIEGPERTHPPVSF